jgi:hypothetical protein
LHSPPPSAAGSAPIVGGQLAMTGLAFIDMVWPGSALAQEGRKW